MPIQGPFCMPIDTLTRQRAPLFLGGACGPPDQKISVSAPNNIPYQLFGSTEMVDDKAKKIAGGGDVLVAGGTTSSLGPVSRRSCSIS